ncbi:DUF1178 family protein [Candidatus Pelagibacter sp.]|jgi:hypothetical protein|nr:DUF1178 family protein [Candidatus Pelagibacter sp.]
MIKYKLICKDCNNIFDSWFASSREYEKLKKKNFLNCHICDSLNIEKTLMSPSILKSIKNTKINNHSNKYRNIKKKIAEYQKFIEKNFTYVGKNFTYEARSVHYKNKKNSKGIYGSASSQDIKELSEEGIEVQIIPWIKDKTN